MCFLFHYDLQSAPADSLVTGKFYLSSKRRQIETLMHCVWKHNYSDNVPLTCLAHYNTAKLQTAPLLLQFLIALLNTASCQYCDTACCFQAEYREVSLTANVTKNDKHQLNQSCSCPTVLHLQYM